MVGRACPPLRPRRPHHGRPDRAFTRVPGSLNRLAALRTDAVALDQERAADGAVARPPLTGPRRPLPVRGGIGARRRWQRGTALEGAGHGPGAAEPLLGD